MNWKDIVRVFNLVFELLALLSALLFYFVTIYVAVQFISGSSIFTSMEIFVFIALGIVSSHSIGCNIFIRTGFYFIKEKYEKYISKKKPEKFIDCAECNGYGEIRVVNEK